MPSLVGSEVCISDRDVVILALTQSFGRISVSFVSGLTPRVNATLAPLNVKVVGLTASWRGLNPVSYTYLTPPTKAQVYISVVAFLLIKKNDKISLKKKKSIDFKTINEALKK